MRARIAGLLDERLALDVPSPDTDLLDEGLLDSLGLVELLVHLEEEFGVTIGLEELDLESFRSVTTIAGFVRRLRSGEPPSAERTSPQPPSRQPSFPRPAEPG